MEFDPRYLRPAEVDALQGDATKAREKLGWEPKVTFKELVRIMVDADVKQLEDELAGRAVRDGTRVADPGFWDGKAVAVTGGAGFLGKPAVRDARVAGRRRPSDPLGRARPARPRAGARGGGRRRGGDPPRGPRRRHRLQPRATPARSPTTT